jgi:hypothetical protein
MTSSISISSQFVRQDHFRTGSGAQRAGADADAAHLAGQLSDLDRVADLNGSLEQQDQSGDEVVDDVLQPEADADAERAGERRKAVQRHSCGRERGEKAERHWRAPWG